MLEIIIIVLILLLFAFEMWGVHKGDDNVDTISEVYWKWRNKLPKWAILLVNVVMSVFLIWVIFHFLGLI